MPTRILRDWTDSLRFDGITADAERLFTRLIMKADDFGRFHADPRLIKGACFPLNDNLRTNDIDRWLQELSTRQLILRYEAAGRKLLAIVNFGQRVKNDTKPKFPTAPGKDGRWMPDSEDIREVPGSSGTIPEEPGGAGQIPALTYSESKAKTEADAKANDVLCHLNSVTGRCYRPTETNLTLIKGRLSEVEWDIEGVKVMIGRQAALWGPDQKMAEYLRPETLFGKQKFGSYYDNRNLPINGTLPLGDKDPDWGQPKE